MGERQLPLREKGMSPERSETFFIIHYNHKRMIPAFENLAPPEREKLRNWVEKQQWLNENTSSQDCLLMVLYKLYEMEMQLNKIAYTVRTHWAD